MTQLAPLAWPAAWHYVAGAPSQTAKFKQHWQDFQVHEQLGFTPSGDGEHVCRVCAHDRVSKQFVSARSRSCAASRVCLIFLWATGKGVSSSGTLDVSSSSR